jgi:hypothetical protein
VSFLVSLVAATIAFWRWEVPTLVFSDVPLPPGAWILPDDSAAANADDPCLVVADVRGEAREVRESWFALLEHRGWQPLENDATRDLYRNGARRLRITIIPLDGNPVLTRLRITVRPCPSAADGTAA